MLLLKYAQDKGGKSLTRGELQEVQMGNQAAHHGAPVANALLYKGDLYADDALYQDLYGLG